MLVLSSLVAFPQRNAEGDWLGTLDVGVKLRLVIHIDKSTKGNLSGTLDSPDQAAKGIPASAVTISADSLHVAVASINGGFNGLFINDTTVSGVWSQGPVKAAMTIVKTKEEVKINRPQTPKPPFGYKWEDVEYDNADKSVHLAGTLTYPTAGGPFPVAILISGSGQQDRNETLFGHKPFAVIADYLTRRGFAVLRVDDRSTGKTSGDLKTATSADFAKDVEAGIAYLKRRAEVDTARIGLIGHSEGGLIAELLASKRQDMNFIVLLGGPGVKGSVLLAEQNKAVLESGGISADIANQYKRFFLQVSSYAVSEKDTSIAYKKAWSFYKDMQKTEKLNWQTLGYKDDTTTAKIVKGLVNTLSLPWMRYFLSTDPATLLQQTNAKVLALNGEKDIQVLPKLNIDGINAALQKSKSKVYDTKILPGLNHLFQKCNLCTVNEYVVLEETFSPDALREMGDWLQQNVQSK